LSAAFDLWFEDSKKRERVSSEHKHKDFCFAGQPALCKGYFPGDVLPCVCGAEGDVIAALSEAAVPAPAGGTPAPAKAASAATDDAEERQGVTEPR
jgi:hypothetical protein